MSHHAAKMADPIVKYNAHLSLFLDERPDRVENMYNQSDPPLPLPLFYSSWTETVGEIRQRGLFNNAKPGQIHEPLII